MSGRRRVKLRIHGLVQGVFYRQSAQEEALRLGLSGWVRNLPDRTVEGEAEGASEAVQQFIEWCHRGPPRARVDRVTVEDQEPREEGGNFSVLR